MKRKCVGCGIENDGFGWYSTQFCSKSCVLQKLQELKARFLEYRALLKK